ncbi:hypothetical protein T484DRAFT_1790488 [Baffinella frigidus]|nr:hypothetical protein T484DRAFT_1790488 [Cryptophyta sp. CCMP2293]
MLWLALAIAVMLASGAALPHVPGGKDSPAVWMHGKDLLHRVEEFQAALALPPLELVDVEPLAAKKRVQESKDIGLVISLMGAHESSAGVQEAGCETLANLAVDEKNEVTILAKGGIEAIMRAMGAHGSSAGVQEKGCLALNNLAWNAGNQEAIAAKGGIEAVVGAMNAHGSSAGVQLPGCLALNNLGIDVCSQAGSEQTR